jgi:hypothetical protein
MAIVTALIVSSPYVLAGHERGAITPTFTVLGEDQEVCGVGVCSDCCPHPTKDNIQAPNEIRIIFFMVILIEYKYSLIIYH